MIGRAALVAALVSAVAATASAAPAPAMAVVEPACPVELFGFDAFVELLRVELVDHRQRCCDVQRRGAATGGASAGDGARVELAIEPCDAAGAPMVVVTVRRSPPAPLQRRAISLADVVPTARSRALALIVAELVRFPGVRPAPPAPTEPPVASTPPPRAAAAANVARAPRPSASTAAAPTARAGATADAGAAVAVARTPAIPEPPPPPAEHAVSASFELRRHVAHDTSLWGPRLAFGRTGERWRIEIDGGAAFGGREHRLGSVALKTITAGVALGPRLRLGWADVDVDARGEIGWAWVSGQSAAGASVVAGAGSALVGAAGARLALSAPAGARLRARLAVELGAALRGLDGRADGTTAAATTGAYVCISAGLTGRL